MVNTVLMLKNVVFLRILHLFVFHCKPVARISERVIGSLFYKVVLVIPPGCGVKAISSHTVFGFLQNYIVLTHDCRKRRCDKHFVSIRSLCSLITVFI